MTAHFADSSYEPRIQVTYSELELRCLVMLLDYIDDTCSDVTSSAPHFQQVRDIAREALRSGARLRGKYAYSIMVDDASFVVTNDDMDAGVHIMTIAEFLAAVESGEFTDDDGYGILMPSDPPVYIRPSNVHERGVKHTHVKWYNK